MAESEQLPSSDDGEEPLATPASSLPPSVASSDESSDELGLPADDDGECLPPLVDLGPASEELDLLPADDNGEKPTMMLTARTCGCADNCWQRVASSNFKNLSALRRAFKK